LADGRGAGGVSQDAHLSPMRAPATLPGIPKGCLFWRNTVMMYICTMYLCTVLKWWKVYIMGNVFCQ